MPEVDTPLLEVREVGKKFPGVRALHDVDLTVQQAEVLSVIGENGAGKSTLMKILAGVQMPDSGQVLIDGQPVTLDSVKASLNNGVALIHQELNLAENLQVGENIYLGREPNRYGFIDRKQINIDAVKVLKQIGLAVEPTTPLSDLSIGQRQMVEIAKAMSVGARVLIMDEPTSSLSSAEAERLFEVVKDLRKRGVSIIYISHRLGEVKALSDRVVVLRDGENAGVLDRDEITHDNMVRMMVGRDVSQFYSRETLPIGDVVLSVDGLRTPTWPEHEITFSIRQGEIVGISGLVGAGRTEMLRTLFGVDYPVAGTVAVDGQTIDLKSPLAAIAAGIALVPEDRKLNGLVIDMSVRHNIGLAALSRNRLAGGFLNRAIENRDATQMIRDLRIKTPNDAQITRFLSGGNQQKVVLGKWLSMMPKILLLDEPTRGIDVGAKQEIYQLMEKLAKEGLAVLFVSSEMEEIMGMSDRTIVMHEGRITGELQRSELSEESIMQLATGNANNVATVTN
ncbi:sugar ABC transporter ATP-binding protein [Rubripirellula sp.]|jgi:ribose transport system ATP-binding protein|nr:sugar ABC transporter ATP-binding protein [Rubripirellula sp.]MDB4634415.1 sugar ABC transporter ATP-binding protein [Rubripirellula sp.]MDB4654471.1 sugar ABC transporter ATP-binding protein [Rubripirellula sp.]